MVNVTVETTPESDAQFKVQLPWQMIDQASDKVYRRIAKTQKVPGFRPGHAPRAIIERMVGRDALYEEAIDELVQDAVEDSAREHELTLLTHAHAHVHEINYGEEHEVSVSVPVLAKGELADVSDIKVAVDPVEVTDEDVDAIIDRARDQLGLWAPVDRPAEIGDRVTVDLKLTVGEKVINDLKDNEFDLVEDRTGIFTGMDQEIVGMTDGETKEFTTTLPEDYGKAEMAGQPANYVVTLNKITVKQIAEVDDEFAKQAGSYESVAAMREGVRADLLTSRENTARRKQRDEVIQAVVDRLDLKIPTLLIEAEVDDLMQEMQEMMSQQRMDLTRYLQLMGKDAAGFREEMHPEAERRIKQRRALELIAVQEGLQVTPKDVEAVIDLYNREPGGRRLRLNQLKPTQRLAIERSLLRDMAIEWLMEHLTVDAASVTIEEAPSVEAPSEGETIAAEVGEAAKEAADAKPAKKTKKATTAPDAEDASAKEPSEA